ncbi:hypothetical protein ACHAPU_009337 [Fusarium lateritium]
MAIFELLVDAMPDLATASLDQWTIFDIALLAGDHEALKILVRKDPNLTSSAWSYDSKDVSRESIGPSQAKRLLAACSSDMLVPPSELYDTYVHALVSLKRTCDTEANAINLASLLKDAFQVLCDAAEITIPTSRVELCQSCESFQHSARLPGKSKPRIQIHQSREELDECAKSCALCRLVAGALDDATAAYDKRNHGETDIWWLAKSDGPDPVQGDMAATAICLQLRYDGFYPLDPDPCTFLSVWDSQERLMVKLPVGKIDEKYLLDTKGSAGIDSSTGSRQSFDIASKWMETCRGTSRHADCRRVYPDGGPELPTRVLDLASFPDPQLIDTGGIRSTYCALSYCWGNKEENLTTTRENVSRHKEGISMASLPMFIQEALLAARTLGYRYIWIDALCIIQDDPDDWDKEASKMKDVYANADLTLSSLVAKGCNEHLFQSRGPMTTRPIPFDIWMPKIERPRWDPEVIHQPAVYPTLLINQTEHEGFSGGGDVSSRAPITSRGWVLQEQMLSTRILYFGSSYILWECLCTTAFDLDPSQSITPSIGGAARAQSREKYAIQRVVSPWDDDPDELEYQPYGLWQSLLTKYTERRLTNPSDRIPAFLAISESLEKAIGEEFIGGVWKGERLLESLSWNVEQADDGQPKAPSWSWASVKQAIKFNCGNRFGHLEKSTSLADLISFDVQTNRSQSQISGSITLKGTLHQREIMPSSWYHQAFFDYQQTPVDQCYALDLLGFERILTDAYIEYSDDDEMDCEEDDDEMNCEEDDDEMDWEEDEAPAVIVRLLLEPVDKTASSSPPCMFRRIGICRDVGSREQTLEDGLLPRKDSDIGGIWKVIKWSEADRVVTIV